MITIFIVGFMILLGTFIKDNVIVRVEGMLGSSAASNVFVDVKGAWKIFDYVFLTLAVGSGIATILLAFQTDVHPAFFFISLFLTVISLIVAPIFSNVFGALAIFGQFNPIAEEYSIMKFVFQNYPTYIFAIGILLTIALFAKMRGGRE